MPIDQNNSNGDQSAESKISRLLGESPGLSEVGAVQRRVRALRSRVVVYLLLSAALYTDQG